jgi:hypothetical protein
MVQFELRKTSKNVLLEMNAVGGDGSSRPAEDFKERFARNERRWW